MKLQEIRKSMGKPLHWVARRAGISQTMAFYIEDGERKPSVEVAKRLSKIYNVPWTAFYEDDDNEARDDS